MRLSRLEIRNFRRIEYADIHLSPASFLIGPNNVGKSTVIKAVEALLSLSSSAVSPDDFRVLPDGSRADKIEICGYFSDIPEQIAMSRGFRGRVIDGQYVYKKTYELGNSKPKIWTRQYEYELEDDFKSITTWKQLIDKGYTQENLEEFLEGKRPANDRLPNGWELKIDGAVTWKTDSEPREVENPGGIPSVVASKLPRLVHIPSVANVDDIGKADGNKTILGDCLGILFEDLLSRSELATGIQDQLLALQEQMSPDVEGSMIDVLCTEVNKVINDVFPDCGIRIVPSLQNVVDVIKPKYVVELFSNVHTDASRQGTGLIRTGIFSMLRYHSHMKSRDTIGTRSLLVAFEEPEIYLHPSAANLLRDTIYALGESDQIICTTHSPWMIDLSKDWQSLTKLHVGTDGYTQAQNYGLSDAMEALKQDEKEQIKMIRTFDDELSRVFFAEQCVVVEGDSELIAIKNTLKHLDEDQRRDILARIQVVKARGKGTIVPLVKYLRALNIPFHVIHDRDKGTASAEKLNQSILEAAGDRARVTMLEECLEHSLGYEPPSHDKPLKTYLHTSKWKTWDDISEQWRQAFSVAFGLRV